MTNANECTCPSGDGSLRHPCPAHPAPVELAGVAATLTFINGRPAMCGCQVEYSSGGGEYSDVIYVTLCAKHSGSAILDLVATNRIALTPEYEGQWHADLYLDREIPLAKAEGATPAEAVLALMSAERIDPEQESVEQAGGDERAGLRAAAKWHREQRNAFEAEAEMHRQRYENTNRPDSLTAEAEHHRRLWETASAMAANHLDYAAGFEEMARAALAQPSPTLPPFAEKVLAKLRRFYDCAEDFESGGVDIGRHWLDLLTQLGLLNRVQRSPALWEISQQGEDLLGTPHPSPAQAEKAEAERQEVVDFNPYRYHAEKIRQRADGAASAYEAGRSALGYMEDIAESALIVRNGLDELSAQHERITAKLHDALDESDGDRWKMRSERDAANARLHEVATACATAEQERDAALAEVERLRQFERICEGLPQDAIDGGWTVQGIRGYAKRLEDQLKSALARVAELEKQEPVGWANFRDGRFGAYLHRTEDDARRFDSTALAGKPAGSKQLALYAAPVAQAQHSVPEEVRTLLSRAQCEIEHLAECLENVCEDEEDFDVREDVADGRVVAADIAHMLAAAPGKEGL
ncbi:TPA: hypothetical protein NIB40_003570 [Pseudomonas aeruginosa]|nr:hypothetical protein [Pseudomonas aeruginosa]